MITILFILICFVVMTTIVVMIVIVVPKARVQDIVGACQLLLLIINRG